jgi:3-hydroxy-3-methylglutaryl CoA synthase
MTSGDGAAAILVGEGKPIAKLLAKASRTADFVDHFRSVDNQFDYQWEERWISANAGYMQIVPPTSKRCWKRARGGAQDVTHPCMPATIPRVANTVAKAVGIGGRGRSAILCYANCGDTGWRARAAAACPPRLEKGEAGEKILVVRVRAWGDALLFDVDAGETGRQARRARRRRPSSPAARRRRGYGRYLAFNDLIELERGMRAEADKAHRCPSCGATARR